MMTKSGTIKMVDKAGNIANPQKAEQEVWEQAGWVVATHVAGKAIIARNDDDIDN